MGYNPHKPGRPSHTYHTYWIGRLRLCLDVEVRPGKEHAVICRRKCGRGFWLVSVVSCWCQVHFKFQRRKVAQGRVEPLGVVEGFDVVEQ